MGHTTRQSLGEYYIRTIRKYNTLKLVRLALRAGHGTYQRQLATLALVARHGFGWTATCLSRHEEHIKNAVRLAARMIRA